MRWSAVALVSFVACHRHPAPVQRETAADAAPPPAPASVVDRWNDAHARRDAQSLEALYAPNVGYYGTELTGAECVRRKAAAFAKTPDFTQSIRDVKLENTPDGKDTWARFEKTTSSGGKAKIHRALLIVRDGRVIEENDDLDESWCLDRDGFMPNDRRVPPFTMSASDAVAAAYATKHMEKMRATHPQIVVDSRGFGCARRCAVPSRECGFHFRTSDLGSNAPSSLVEWLYLDPTTKLLWWEEPASDGGLVWRSEPVGR